ncbi:MAG: hypothetical protein IJX55_10615 [Clostridia bacterium]|nr:hypothetical protein [Clostridia bacterium]
MLEWQNADIFPCDNFFDITNGRASVRLIGSEEDMLSENLKITSVYDVK